MQTIRSGHNSLKYTVIACILLMGVLSCTKVRDLISPPLPREKYARDFSGDTALIGKWNALYQRSLADSLKISLPYTEAGNFDSSVLQIYAYDVILKRGEVCHINVLIPDSIRIFIDIFRYENDSIGKLSHVSRNDPMTVYADFQVEETGEYKIVLQPGIEAHAPFAFMIYRRPTYGFPVAGHGNAAIQSFWGAPRTGGRIHEGIDVFAPRGTPVVAVAKGRIGFAGERGLGGKQVWQRTGIFGHSIYYAHLDSIAVSELQRVERGDTIGFVGNTGNAYTTSPHLHFGIYPGGGAVDPLPYVLRSERPEFPETFTTQSESIAIVTAALANLRQNASARGDKLGEAQRGDTLDRMGKSGQWWHIRTQSSLYGFVHESLVD